MNTATAITMKPVSSSQIAAIGYDPEAKVLAIQFTAKSGPGSLYHYQRVTPEVFAAFESAESIGSHFGRFIKPFGEMYPFAKIDQAAALATQQDASRREDDHGPALAMNAEFDAAALARCTATAQAMLTNGRSLVESHSDDAIVDAHFDELDPTNREIEEMGRDCGLNLQDWTARLELFVAWARAEQRLPGGLRYSTTTFKDNGDPILLNADGSRSIFCDVDE